MNVKAEMGMVFLQAKGVKEGWQPSDAGAEAGNRPTLELLEGTSPCQPLDLGLLASQLWENTSLFF